MISTALPTVFSFLFFFVTQVKEINSKEEVKTKWKSSSNIFTDEAVMLTSVGMLFCFVTLKS